MTVKTQHQAANETQLKNQQKHLQPDIQTTPNLRKQSLPYHGDGKHYFEKIKGFAYPVYFDSNAASSNGRFDIITAAPRALLSSASSEKSISNTIAHNAQTVITLPDTLLTSVSETISNRALVNTAEQLLSSYASTPTSISTSTSTSTAFQAASDEFPFVSGLVGLFSYEFGLSRHALTSAQGTAQPNILLGIYQWAIIIDHEKKRSHLVADNKLPDNHWLDLSAWLEDCSKKIDIPDSKFRLTEHWQSNLNRKQYNEQFKTAIDYIESGDCYQINLAQRFSSRYQGSPWQAYQHLRATAPTPFAFYMETTNTATLSLSPERFISVDKGHVITQPIKGTRKRGENPEQDKLLIEELKSAEKDRAENLMIVDLLRNDLGKHCKHGSIAATELFKIETHPNVHHMVSTITGELAEVSAGASLKLLLDCLPGGSITGAPKKRAMEIIAELEPNDRSLYCGSCVYIDRGGNMDSNILIRSLLAQKDPQYSSSKADVATEQGDIYCWGGGGIVADSNADAEYAEALQKIQNLLDKLADLQREE